MEKQAKRIENDTESQTPPERYVDFRIVERAYMVVDAIHTVDLQPEAHGSEAYLALRCGLDVMCATILRVGGEVVKSLEDELEATFEEPAAALAAALGFLSTPVASASPHIVGVRIALTFGGLIQYTFGGCTDYFGRDVILASRMARDDDAAGLSMSQTFVNNVDLGAADFLQRPLPRAVRFNGISDPAVVYHVSLADCQVGAALDAELPVVGGGLAAMDVQSGRSGR